MAKNEIKVKDGYVVAKTLPDYRYGQSQDGLDLRRQRNGGFLQRISILDNTVYLANSSGLVHGTANAGATATITGYVGNTSSPSTVVAENSIDVPATSGRPFICFPVQKGEYYKIDSTTGLQYGYFTPTY